MMKPNIISHNTQIKNNSQWLLNILIADDDEVSVIS